jgi:uncharacterized damage-inducible protein DinB
MFRTIEDFQSHWAYEVDITDKMLRNLTDASLEQRVTPDGRNLGFLAWHIAVTPGEMLAQVGLNLDGPSHEAPAPSTAAEIATAYETAANSTVEQVAGNWTDETLLQSDEMYGETWTRGQTLFYMTLHQTHHRGQLTVLMRQAGLAVPGAYGPAREEWAAMGVPALP